MCREEDEVGEVLVPLQFSAVQRTAFYTGIPESTVYRITAKEASLIKKKPGPRKLTLDHFDMCVLRRAVSEIMANKVLPTTAIIAKAMQEKIGYDGGEANLRSILKQIGFRWKKCETNRAILMERQDVVLARIKYLRQIRKYREEGRPIIYTDETFIHTSHASQKAWQSDETSVNVPISKGERCIIVDAGSEHGFVQGARLVYDRKSSSGDYHSEMNSEKFMRWLRERLIPNLPPRSVVVIDNAPYHSVQQNKCPNQSSRKADIQTWLTRNGVAWSNDMLKVELLELCKINRPSPTYAVDQTLKQHGHVAIRLPPYHAELNPIELIWAKLKGKVAKTRPSKPLRQKTGHRVAGM